MNKNILAIAIAAATFGTQAVAVEVYNNDGTTFAIGGHVTAALAGGEERDTTVEAVSPRINMTATQDMGNGFTIDARGEWSLNFLENGGNSFSTRLGYIGLTHEEMGRAVIGTQWAPFYDVASLTDMPIAFANDFLYDGMYGGDFALTGQTRADQMISYRNGFDFAEAGSLNFGLAWQGKNDNTSEELIGTDANGDLVYKEVGAEFDDRIQLAVSYSIMGAQLGYAYSTGDVTESNNTRSLDFHAVSAAYGSYGNGLYLAALYQMTEDKNVTDIDAYELIAAYALANSLNLSINYETVESQEKNKAKETDREEMALQAEYNFTSNVVGFGGYQFDLEGDDDRFMIGARVYL
ncbi:porin [Vibrio agarivorans]|uniref:porin n=1 Tax=Vibrio agarivorans TaxID=153622 RepID=UPI0022307CE2|nr:porin [Vibrio agarivorans]